MVKTISITALSQNEINSVGGGYPPSSYEIIKSADARLIGATAVLLGLNILVLEASVPASLLVALGAFSSAFIMARNEGNELYACFHKSLDKMVYGLALVFVKASVDHFFPEAKKH